MGGHLLHVNKADIVSAHTAHMLGAIGPMRRGRPLADRHRWHVRDDRDAKAQLHGNAARDQLGGVLFGGEPRRLAYAHLVGALGALMPMPAQAE